MQRHLLAVFSVVCACGASAPAPAGLTVSAQVTGLLSQFPAGGAGLRTAVTQVVETDPTLVDELVFATRNASPNQKEDIGEGLAGAANYFAKCGAECSDVERSVHTAISLAASRGTPMALGSDPLQASRTRMISE
jgi:hypothetical protein